MSVAIHDVRAGTEGEIMPDFAISRFEQWTGGRWHGGRLPESVEGFSFDSRRTTAGDCFVALSSAGRDGHDYVADALAAGAACAIVERTVPAALPQLVVGDSLSALGALAAARRRAFPGTVIGVTGSAGKTSTKNLLREVLGPDRTCATPGNWNNLIGVPMTLLGLDPVRHRYAVVEAGISEPGEMDRLGALIEADIVVVTSIGRAHLEGLGSVERIAQEKAGLLRRARSGAPVFAGPGLAQYPEFAAAGHRFVEAGGPELGYRRTLRPGGASAVSLEQTNRDPLTFGIAASSPGMAANAVLAAAVARELGISDDAIAAGLGRWRPDASRGRVVDAGERRYYVDCYNANPDSMADALEAFEAVTPSGTPRCYVIGQMDELGGGAVALHRETGRRLRLSAFDRVYLVGNDELVAAYRKGIAEANGAGHRIRVASGPEEIARELAGFRGAVFLKASRSLGLERVLPAEGREVPRC